MARLFRLLLIGFAAFGLSTGPLAQSPREQLAQMVAQLQKAPGDSALREQIIKLSQTLKPPQELPVEAERRMARGIAAFKGAKSTVDFRDAVKEFELATLAAPWHGDAYFNLGMAQDKAEDYDGALRSLKWALSALRGSKEVASLIYEVEYRKEKSDSPAARAIREKEGTQRFIASLEGAKFDCGGWKTDDDAWKRDIAITNGKVVATQMLTWIHPKNVPGVNYSRNAYVGFKGMWFTPNDFPIQGTSTTGRQDPWETHVEFQDNRLVWEVRNGGKKFDGGVCQRR